MSYEKKKKNYMKKPEQLEEKMTKTNDDWRRLVAKFQHVVRKVLEGGEEASVVGANVSHYNSIIIRFSIYICEVFVLFSRIYSSRVVSLSM